MSASSSSIRKAKQAETYNGTQSSLPPCLANEYNDREETNISEQGKSTNNNEEKIGKKRKATSAKR